MKRFRPIVICLLLALSAGAQDTVISIKSFGARGNGRTNDGEAFERAAEWINRRGGGVRLRIPRGTYIVGRQVRGGAGSYLQGVDVLHLEGVKNVVIEGETGARLRYAGGLKFGSFDPATGRPLTHTGYFVSYPHLAYVGHAIYLRASERVTVRNLEIDGNAAGLVKGGSFGDVGIQAPHYGIFISESTHVTVEGVNAHHLALDGISVANKTPQGIKTPHQNITIRSSRFTDNGRQGLSWIGGIGLTVTDSRFDRQGRGVYNSPPASGVDIEGETGVIAKGVFRNSTFNDNAGCGLVADGGESRDVTFTGCTFTGSVNWSAWVTKPAFRFNDCTFYGSFVHGYSAPSDADATAFRGCRFFDVKEGKEMYGKFLFESNNASRLLLEDCVFRSTVKKVVWIEGGKWKEEEKYRIYNTVFEVANTNLPEGDFAGLIRLARMKGVTYRFTPAARAKKYYINECCGPLNTDLGGNQTL